MLVANAIAFICEAADHHADLAISWPSVGVALSTHSAGGITAKDFEVATLIETQVTWSRERGRRWPDRRNPL
jgi:4a-hydroxytetrahydrobiopterin dehydratase